MAKTEIDQEFNPLKDEEIETNKLRQQLAAVFLADYVFKGQGSIEERVEFVHTFFPKWKAEGAKLHLIVGGTDEISKMHAKAYEAVNLRDCISHAVDMVTENTKLFQQYEVGSERWLKFGALADEWSRVFEVTIKASQPL